LTLSSSFTLGSGRPTAWAHCQYLLAARRTTPQMWFMQQASELDGAIVETGQMQIDTLTIDWAHIERPELLLTVFLGTAKLPSNRQLDIEVNEITGDFELAEQAFKHIVKSVNFKDNQLLQAGAEIIAAIKSKGLGSFLENQNQQAFFLINDSRRRAVGFTMDVLIDSGGDAQSNIQGAGHLYIKGQPPFEQVASFQSGDNLDAFVYKSQTYSQVRRSRTEIILGEAGLMTVRKFAARTEEKDYYLSPTAIPGVFLDQLLRQILDSNKKEIVVDIIEADGKIAPTFVSRIESKKDAADDAAYVLKLELLDERGFSEQVYLNDQKQIYKKRLVQQQSTYFLESTNAENIAKEFPEHAEYVLQKSRMPK